jgi:hypothetical protein
MRVTIDINVDNEAFDVVPGLELYRILNDLAKEYRYLNRADTLDGKKLLDKNGNRVGEVRVTP